MIYKIFRGETFQQALVNMMIELGEAAKDARVIDKREVKKGPLGLFGKYVEITVVYSPKSTLSAVQEKIQEVSAKELMDIKSQLQELSEKFQKLSVYQSHQVGFFLDGKSALSEVYQKLIDNEVDNEIIMDLISKLQRETPPELLYDKEYLIKKIQEYIHKIVRVVEGIKLDTKPKVCALVGNTGVGKTTTLIKLATEFCYNKRRQVAVVTLDTYRVAAIEQLGGYCRILGIPVDVVYNAVDFPLTLKKFKSKDLILIDTAGKSHKDVSSIAELKTFFDISGFQIEIYLVISANLKFKEMMDIAKAYRKLPYHKLILTKLDETISFGYILKLLRQIPEGIAYLTTGQDVPGDIEEADPAVLAKIIFS